MVSIRFYVVGSSVTGKRTPRDLDIMAVMSNEDFNFIFGMTHRQFNEEYKKPYNPKIDKWHHMNEGARLVLSQFYDKRYIDIKFACESMLYGKRREVTLDELRELD